jgi:type IV pilus assembly protein PilF
MTWGRRHSSTALACAALCGFVALLAGCTTTTTVNGVEQAPPQDRSGDDSDASKRARVRMELAGAYFARGQMNTALDEVKLALQAQPNLVEGYNLRGLIYAGLNDDVQAQDSFRRALQLSPNDGDTLHNYGWYMCQQKRFAEATPLFDQATAAPRYTGAVRTMLAKGVCQARAGQWPEAEATLTRAYELDPGNAATGVNLAEVLLRREQYERARFYIRRVNAVPDQVSSQTLWLAARVEQKLGNSQGVRDLGRQLRDRFPQSRESSAFERGQFDE